MKVTLLFALFCAFFTTASAQAETFLIDQQGDTKMLNGGSQFQVSAELGRAWMEITFLISNRNNESSRSPFSPYYVRAKVPGLSYDAANGRIVFSGAKGLTVCANTSVRHSVWGTKLLINPTGKCATRADYALHQVDDGFEVKAVHTLDTYFSVQE
jgi:hypothetical protein